MSSFDVEVLPEAEAEAREAFLWYFERSPFAADAFRVELFDAIDSLSVTALDWPEDDDGSRHYHLKHFRYTVLHEALGAKVTVFAIVRASPSRWARKHAV